jgi:hypothetical protein
MNRRLWYIKSAEIFSWLAEEKLHRQGKELGINVSRVTVLIRPL